MQNPPKKKVLDQAQNPPKKLLDQVRDAIRLKYYSYRTEETYVQWIRRYILFHNKRHPNEMGTPENQEPCRKRTRYETATFGFLQTPQGAGNPPLSD